MLTLAFMHYPYLVHIMTFLACHPYIFLYILMVFFKSCYNMRTLECTEKTKNYNPPTKKKRKKKNYVRYYKLDRLQIRTCQLVHNYATQHNQRYTSIARTLSLQALTPVTCSNKVHKLVHCMQDWKPAGNVHWRNVGSVYNSLVRSCPIFSSYLQGHTNSTDIEANC